MQDSGQQRAALIAARKLCRRRLRAALQPCCVLFIIVAQLSAPLSSYTARGEHPHLRLRPETPALDSFLADKLREPGDLTLRKTALPDALFAIGELWKLNLVVGEEVQGQVNCDFKQAPLGEILNTVLLSNGYSYRPFGRSLVIVRLADMGDVNPLFESATIPIQAGDPQELADGASVFNSPKGKTKALPTSRSLLVVDYPDRVAMIRDFIRSLADSSETDIEGPGAGELQTLQLRPQYVPAIMLKDALAAALSKEGKVVVIDGENRVVVVDYAYNLRLARDVMAQVDRPRPQVRITAYIYDIGLQDMETLGINWSHALKGRLDAGNNPQSSWAVDALTTVPFDGAVGGAMTFMNMSDNFDLEATLNALNSCRDSRLLADPNVVVVDNEPATVAIITEIPFQQLTETGQGGNIGTTAFREAGVKLNVLPRIADDGTIQMVVEPEFSRLTGFTPETDQPIIDRRTAKTTVRVANGQTVVIGGLRQRTDVGNFHGIPFLKDIPYLGVLFRSRETDVRESELLVFIKPEVVSYADPLNCREMAAVGTTHRFLDQIPIAQPTEPSAPMVEHLPPVHHAPQGKPQPSTLPQPLPPSVAPPEEVRPLQELPRSVEQSSPGLALTAQRGRAAYDAAHSVRPDGDAQRPRNAWQTSVPPAAPASVTQQETHRAIEQRATRATSPTASSRESDNGEASIHRLPPVRREPVMESALPPRKATAVPSSPVFKRNSTNAPTPPAGPVAPASSAEPAPVVPGENRVRLREHMLDGSDEMRSATWINNVFRY